MAYFTVNGANPGVWGVRYMVRVSGAFGADLWRIMENDKGRLGKNIAVGCCWGKGKKNAGDYSVYGYRGDGGKGNTCFCNATWKIE